MRFRLEAEVCASHKCLGSGVWVFRKIHPRTQPNFFQNAGSINNNSKGNDSFSGNGMSSGGLCVDMTSNTLGSRGNEVSLKNGRQQFSGRGGYRATMGLLDGTSIGGGRCHSSTEMREMSRKHAKRDQKLF